MKYAFNFYSTVLSAKQHDSWPHAPESITVSFKNAPGEEHSHFVDSEANIISNIMRMYVLISCPEISFGLSVSDKCLHVRID